MDVIAKQMREALVKLSLFLTNNGETVAFSTWSVGEENTNEKSLITAGIVIVTESDDDFEYVGRGTDIVSAIHDLDARLELSMIEMLQEDLGEDNEDDYVELEN